MPVCSLPAPCSIMTGSHESPWAQRMSLRNFVITGLVLLLLALQYALWLGSGNLVETWHLRLAVEDQRQENTRLGERNRVLEAEVVDLNQGLDAVEERARRELGMIKKGETFYQVIESPTDSR